VTSIAVYLKLKDEEIRIDLESCLYLVKSNRDVSVRPLPGIKSVENILHGFSTAI
jgi:hypothetical protein